jgi:hypothetical protein
MEWSNEKTIEFVEGYRGFTCLWRSSDPDYKDTIKRGDAQQYLAGKYGLQTGKAVNDKIKSLRSYFHEIHSEVKRRKSGDGCDDDVEPNWFLYKYLVFILDGEDNRAGKQSFSTATGTSQASEDSCAPTEEDNNKVSSISNITYVEQQ